MRGGEGAGQTTGGRLEGGVLDEAREALAGGRGRSVAEGADDGAVGDALGEGEGEEGEQGKEGKQP